MTENIIKEGKTLAIVSYLTLFGTIIAFFMNQDKKNEFTAFHTRQALGLWILQMILGYVIGGFDNWNITLAFWIGISVLLFYGVLTAISGKVQPIPLLGDFFQKVFASLGK
ncbi:hypothetical protein [Gaetbulibacter sp. PBL-D1]|uniref:hypothetical protein n=1 Tax=Gaetbulibacter sp. PBL-D1 TaxID=3422594 RepID=UPI003D2F22F5